MGDPVIWVALASIVAAIAAFGTTGTLVRSLIRQQARERERLVDQVCYLAGRTWSPPPAEQYVIPEDEPEPYIDPALLPDY